MALAQGSSQARALREAGTVVTELVNPGMPRFAFALLPRDGSSMERYFEQVKPFYTIGLAGSIASALTTYT